MNGEFIETLDLSGRVEEGKVALGTGYYTTSEQVGFVTEYESFALWPVTAVHGPESGSLEHILDDLIKLEAANVNQTNMIISANFDNPFGTEESDWDIGFAFRDDDDAKYWLILASEGYWELVERYGDPDTDSTVQDGDLDNLDLNAGESNQVTVIVWGEAGYLFVNGEFIEELNLANIVQDGDVEVITAFYFDHEIEGESTDYDDFVIWQLP